LHNAGLTSADLDEFIVAGAFGTYLDLRSAVRVGMFPSLPLEKFRQVGTRWRGARQMLVSVQNGAKRSNWPGVSDYLELATDKGFMELFMKDWGFD